MRWLLLAGICLAAFPASAGQWGTVANGGGNPLAVVGVGSAPQMQTDPTKSSLITPGRAADFVDSLGVNVHPADPIDTVANVTNDMNFVGIHRYRRAEIFTEDRSSFDIGISNGVPGLRILMGYATPGAACGPISSMQSMIDKVFAHTGVQTVDIVEGPNECDAAGYTCDGKASGSSSCNAAQIDLWNFINTTTDAAFSGVHVAMRPLASQGQASGYSVAPSVLTSCNSGPCADWMAIHDYMADWQPNGPDGTGSVSNFVGLYQLWWRSAAGVTSKMPGAPTISTEFGSSLPGYFPANKSCDELTCALWILTEFMSHWEFAHGEAGFPIVKAVNFQYDLIGESSSCAAAGCLGLYDNGNNIRGRGNVIHNLTRILNDTGTTATTFVPTPVGYTFTGFDQDTHVIPFQKSNGTYEIYVQWQTEIYDGTNDVNPTPRTITLKFNKVFPTIRFYDVVNGMVADPAAQGTVLNTDTLTFSLAGHPVIVEAIGGAQTQVTPSPNDSVVWNGQSSTITDASGNLWTVSGGVIQENGNTSTGTTGVTQIDYIGGQVWQENSSNLWWFWNGTTWQPSGGQSANPFTASADKTVVQAGSLQALIDSSLNEWTLLNGVVQQNGANAGFTAGVIEIAYVGGQIWQENSSNLWWFWNGTTWVSGSNPGV